MSLGTTLKPSVSPLPAFTALEDSLWLTLCCRALDNRRPHPTLGDKMADQIVRTLNYDYRQLNIKTNLLLNVTVRAKKLDEVTARFLAGHPDAVGLELGSGLDTRFERVAPPSTVDWYDVASPRSPSPEMAWSPSTPTPTSSARTCGTPTGWRPSPATGRP